MSFTPHHEIVNLPISPKLLKIQSNPIKVPNSKFEIYPISYKSRNRPLLIQTPRLYLPFGLSNVSLLTQALDEANNTDNNDQNNNSYKNNSNNNNSNNNNSNNNQHSNFKNRKTSKSRSNQARYFLHLSLDEPESKSVKTFIETMSSIDNHLHKEWGNYNFSESIKIPTDRFYPPFIKAKIPSNNNKYNKMNYQVFDLFNSPRPIDYIAPGSWATSILYLKHLWVNGATCQVGLTWYVLQSKVKTPIPELPSKCIIDDPWDDETICAICHKKVIKESVIKGVDDDKNSNSDKQSKKELPPLPQEYEKYTRMIKLGIPMLAIIQRCQLDGLDPEVLRNRHKSKISNEEANLPTTSVIAARLPPPPPMPSTNLNKKKNTGLGNTPRIAWSAEDLKAGKSNLGKNEIKVRHVMTLNLKKRDPRVPSLSMILSKKNGLRSTPKPKDFMSDVK
tara:strand:+ start:673 stop:2016 length:1344 start_codon:yes stop_codon:yes gene_type:complete